MITDDMTVTLGATGQTWSPAVLGETGTLPQPMVDSPDKFPLQGSDFFVSMTNTVVAGRASHCCGLTTINGRLAKPLADARTLRGVSFRRRNIGDLELGCTPETSSLRSSSERTGGDEHDVNKSTAKAPSRRNLHTKLQIDTSSNSGSDSESDAGHPRSRKAATTVGATTGLLHLPALPASALLPAGNPLNGSSTNSNSLGTGAAPSGGPSGITLAFLESLRAASPPGATLRDVYRTLILPTTRAARCAYVQLLGAGSDYRAKPSHVLVCSWDERISDIVELLADHAAAAAAAAAFANGESICEPGGSRPSSVCVGPGFGFEANGTASMEGSGWRLRRRDGGGMCSGTDSSPFDADEACGDMSGSSAAAAVNPVSFAVWMDLFAVNFHAAAAPFAPSAASTTAAASGASSFGAASRLPSSKPAAAPSQEATDQERVRALPAAIAAIKSVLLLPGAQGAALREPPCMVAVWHALRGRGCAGGASLAVVPSPELDVELVQTAFENLAVSAKQAEEQEGFGGGSGSGNGNSGGSGGGVADGATRLSADRIAVRAMREGAAVNAVAATAAAAIYAADPLPSRTVREGVSAAVVAAATALLSRPIDTVGTAAVMQALSSSSTLLPPAAGAGAPPQSTYSGRASSIASLELSPPPPPQQQQDPPQRPSPSLPPPLQIPSPLSSSSRAALLPSSLRSGGGGISSPSPAGRSQNPVNEALVRSSGTFNGAAAATGATGSTSLRRVASYRAMSFTNISISRPAACGDDVEGSSEATRAGSSGSGGSVGSGGGGGGGGSRVVAAAGGSAGSGWQAASESGCAMDRQASRRVRSLAPLLDAPSASVSENGAVEGGGVSSPSQLLQQLRRRTQAPWEMSTPLSNPAVSATSTSNVHPGNSSSMLSSAVPALLLRTADSAGVSWPGVGGRGGGGGGGGGGEDTATPAAATMLGTSRDSTAGAASTARAASTGPEVPALSLPLPKLAPLQLQPPQQQPQNQLPPMTSAAAVVTAASAPLPRVRREGRSPGAGTTAPAATGSAPATGTANKLEDEAGAPSDGRPSPFSQNQPRFLQGMAPHYTGHVGLSDGEGDIEHIDVDATATARVEYDSDGERELPPIVLDSRASFLLRARTPEFNKPLAASSLSAPPPPPPPPPPPAAPHYTSVTATVTASDGLRDSLDSPQPHAALSSSPSPSPQITYIPYRPLAPDLARLIAAARLLAAMGQTILSLRLARHAYTVSRSLHGFNHPDTARCAVALARLAHHCQQQQQQQQATPGAAAAVTQLKSGSGTASARCLSPAHSRFLSTPDISDSEPPTITTGRTASLGPSGLSQSRIRFNSGACGGGGGGTGVGCDGSGYGGVSKCTASELVTSSPYCEDPEAFLRGAVVVLERYLGPGHEEVVWARQGLAAVLAAAGRHEEAIPLLQRAVSAPAGARQSTSLSGRPTQAVSRQRRRAPHLLLGEALLAASLELAACLAAAGRPREARQLLKAQLVKLGEDEDEMSALPAYTYPSSGGSAAQESQPGAEVSAALQGLTALKRAELLGKCAHQLAQLKAAAGKTHAARILFRRAVENFSVVYGSRHAVTAGAMLGLAALSQATREYGEALDLFRAVLDVYVELYGPYHPATTRVSNRLGAVEEALEDERDGA